MSATADVVVTAEYLGSAVAFPILSGLQPDFYRCFMHQTWMHASAKGIVTLVHPESHFTDEKAGLLREQTYLRLRRHWQFINELMLYEVDHHVRFGVHVYGRYGEEVDFLMASCLYHPDTVERSLKHDGSGDEPGLKDPEGNWDLRPHRSRILNVTDATLQTWHDLLEDPSIPMRQTRMAYTVNRGCRWRAGNLGTPTSRQTHSCLEFSRGWDEPIDRKKGYFESRWGAPNSWKDVILQGPHLYVATPMYKSVNPTMKNKLDWSASRSSRNCPQMLFRLPLTSQLETVIDTTLTIRSGSQGSARKYYRIAWRAMGVSTNERTLFPALIPPGAAHPNGVFSIGLPQSSLESLCVLSGFMSSLLADYVVRCVPKSGIYLPTVKQLPVLIGHPLQRVLVLRCLRLNCVADAYADLWQSVYQEAFAGDRWTGGLARVNRPDLGAIAPNWTAKTPLRIAEDRRQALVEIDALVALMLDVRADQLCAIYSTQFAVLYGYDHKDNVYDANGRLVPNSVLAAWRKKGDQISGAERTATNQAGHTYIYELPFRLLDREADMRAAYAEFERRLAAHE